jgi:hypothetical protein
VSLSYYSVEWHIHILNRKCQCYVLHRTSLITRVAFLIWISSPFIHRTSLITRVAFLIWINSWVCQNLYVAVVECVDQDSLYSCISLEPIDQYFNSDFKFNKSALKANLKNVGSWFYGFELLTMWKHGFFDCSR